MLDEHRKQEYEIFFRPLSPYGNRYGPSPHVFTGAQVHRRREVVTLQNEDQSSTSTLCMLSSGDLGFTADGHRVL